MYQLTNNVSISFIPMHLSSENIKHFYYQESILISVSYLPYICLMQINKRWGGDPNKTNLAMDYLGLFFFLSLHKKSTLIH